jgi:hypothetical protein
MLVESIWSYVGARMIETRKKRYQITLWVLSREDTSDPGLRLEFDGLEDALAAFEEHRRAGAYKSGLMVDWRSDLGEWFLLDQYSLD